MKKFTILISILVLCAMSLFAQAPEKFTYQAVVRNASNSLVTNAQVGVRVSVLQGTAQGTPVFVETHSVNTNANGLLTLEIGGGNAQTGTFTAINWAEGVYFLKTEIDPNGGSNYSVTTTQQLLSVPYALYAKQAENGFSGDYNDLTNTPTIPTVPTNVSAFTNDAGYITMDSVPAIPTVPTNVSAFTNDAGYLTGYTETDPLFNAWDKNYNDLTNTPTIPTVPTNVSAFTNDAGYITMDSIPTIPMVPTNVSAFTNDAGYLTGYTETDPQFNAWDKNYNDLINKPVIPTVPTNVSAFTNDAGYLTGYTETDPQFNAWDKDYNDLTNKPVIPTVPTNVSAFTNDAGYITMDSIPAIPTVPTNVSAFTNDAGYLTGYTETDPQFNAWDKDYNDLTNKPNIPTVPTNVSAFTNDAGYITMDSIPAIPTVPTNVSAFTNDAGYLTDYTETDPQFNAWNKSYNDLTDKPEIPTVPTNVSAFTNDAGYITMDSIPAITTVPTNVSAFTNDAGYITMDSIPAIPTVPTNVSAFTNDAGYLTGYTETDPQFNAWDKDYNDLTNKPNIPTVPTNVSAFTNDAGYITMDSIPAIPTVPTNVSAFTNDAGYLTGYTETDPQFNAWNKSYNDLTDKPEIPTVPTNVSAFTNDAGYITMDSVPAIPTNVSAFTNDAGYLTSANVQEAANIPTNVSAFTNDAGYITMDSIPAISEIPTDVSAFNNDMGYLTEYTETDPLFSAWSKDYNDLTNTPTIPTVPTNVSAFTNDAGYITMDSIPAIPDVPTDVSAFTNDAGYLTSYTETDPQFNAWNKSYNDLIDKPVIPAAANDATLTIQRNGVAVGTFSADATDNQTVNIAVPTQTSQLENNSGYLTMADLQQLIDALNQRIDSLENVINGGTTPPAPEPADGVPCPGNATVTDVEGNTYNTVKIGEQCWMKENLRTTKFADNTEIPFGNQSSVSNPYRYYPNNDASNVATYGYLYNWNAVMHGSATSTSNPSNVQGICPSGWHVPSNAEWLQLLNYLRDSDHSQFQCGGETNNVAKAVAATTGWNSVSTVCAIGNTLEDNNASGFSALSAGMYSGAYTAPGSYAKFWTATQTDNTTAIHWTLHYTSTMLTSLSNYNKYYGMSVRCVLGEGEFLSLPTVTTAAVSSVTDTSVICGGNVSDDGGASVTAYGICWGTYPIPSLYWDHTTDGTGTGSFTSSLTGLTPSTTYYVRAYATNSVGTAYGEILSFTTEAATSSSDGLPCPGFPTVTDIDGNTYNTIMIGEQCWMKENLRTTKFADGIDIPHSNNGLGYANAAYRYVPGNDTAIVATYGYRYNLTAALHGSSGTSIVQGVCPSGWHLPSEAEFTQLTDYLKSQNGYVCGNTPTKIAKALASTTGWISSTVECSVGNDTNSNNATGFGLLSAGNGGSTGRFAYLWSGTRVDDTHAKCLCLRYNWATVTIENGYSSDSYSIRCVLNDDAVSGAPTVNTNALSTVLTTSVFCGGNVTDGGESAVTEKGLCWSTSPTPTIADSHIACGTGTGSFSTTLTGLTSGTTYYIRAYATNGVGTAYGNEVFCTTAYATDGLPCPEASTVTDIDGNSYSTVKIGTQCWMKENLRTTKYADGTAILLGPDTSSTIAYRYRPNNDSTNVPTYGYLYNWSAVIYNQEGQSGNIQGICPTGWHVPNYLDMSQFVEYLNGHGNNICGDNNANLAKAVASTTGWLSSTTTCAPGNNQASNNSSGFNLLPSGNYNTSSTSSYFGARTVLWDISSTGTIPTHFFTVYNYKADFSRYGGIALPLRKTFAYSVRCIRD